MSGFLDNLHDHHQHHREQREERREARHERHERGGRQDDYDNDNYGSQRHAQRPPYEDEESRRPQSYSSQGQTHGYAPSSGPLPSGRGTSGFTSQGGLDRDDFASDADIDRMVATGTFEEGQGRQGYGRGGADGERRYDAPSGPPSGQGYSARYDAPSGPPPGRGYQSQEPQREDYESGGAYASGYGGGPDRQNQYGSQQGQGRPQYEESRQQGYGSGGAHASDYGGGPDRQNQYGSQQGQGRAQYEEPRQQGYGSGGAHASSYGGGPDRQNQHGSQQGQGRSQYDTPQGPPTVYGRGQGNTPSGGFSASGDGEERYGGGPPGDRNEPPRRGEAAGYYNQQGSSGREDRYAHLAGLAQEHGDDDPEVYRQATQGLHEKIQSQAPSRRPGRDDENDYKSHVDAHRKAYGEDDHGPMDADTIGAAAAMEAFKQTAAGGGSSNAPAGAFQAGKASGGPSSRPGRAAARDEEEEEDTTAARGGASGGLQDKLMALAMSHAGKLFDKKNAGSSASGGDMAQGKAQAMQSAATTAMQLFSQYQTKGKLESGDMQKVIGLAMNMF